MSNFRETRETLLYSHFNNVIDEEEFVFLFYLNSSKIPDIKYWKYHTVDLNSYDDDVVSQILIYKKRHPSPTRCPWFTVISTMTMQSILLKHYAFFSAG